MVSLLLFGGRLKSIADLPMTIGVVFTEQRESVALSVMTTASKVSNEGVHLRSAAHEHQSLVAGETCLLKPLTDALANRRSSESRVLWDRRTNGAAECL